MDDATTTSPTLTDDDIETVWRGSATSTVQADHHDGDATDSGDGDATDSTDGDAGDGDASDSGDGDPGDADGQDA